MSSLVLIDVCLVAGVTFIHCPSSYNERTEREAHMKVCLFALVALGIVVSRYTYTYMGGGCSKVRPPSQPYLSLALLVYPDLIDRL